MHKYSVDGFLNLRVRPPFIVACPILFVKAHYSIYFVLVLITTIYCGFFDIPPLSYKGVVKFLRHVGAYEYPVFTVLLRQNLTIFSNQRNLPGLIV